MANDFVRNIKGIRNIDILSPNITTENDLISTNDGEVYVVTNKGYRKITGVETKEIKQLKTDVSNVKIQSDSNTLNISDNTDDIETNTSEIETLKTNTDNNTSEISTLKTSTDNNTSEIETLQTTTGNNTSEIETLKTDTSKHQKYKLTESNGNRIRVSDIDPVELDTGFYQLWNTYNMAIGDEGAGSYWNVEVFSAMDTKQIRATLSYTGRVFQKNIHKGVDKGWKELTGITRTLLYEGSASNTGDVITLNQPYNDFTELKIKISRTGGNEILIFDAEDDGFMSINITNIYDDNSEMKLYEMTIDKNTSTELEISGQRSNKVKSDSPDEDSRITILKIWGVK